MRGVIVSLVQARWARWIRENDRRLAADRELEDFLFGSARTNVAIHAERFYELQSGPCFYTGEQLQGPRFAEVDHFIPWSRYPFDSPFNLVLASRKVNNKMRDHLKPIDWRDRWLGRNEVEHDALTLPAPQGFGAATGDAIAARTICAWLYANKLA